MSHILHAYRIAVRQRRTSQDQLLGNFDGAGSDLLAEFKAFFNDPQNKDWADEEGEASARIAKFNEPDSEHPDTVSAIIEVGESGLASDIYARTDAGGVGNKPIFFRQRDHTEMVPVVILAKLPGSRTTGFLVTHLAEGRGIKTRFWRQFQEWFNDRHSEYSLHLDPCAPEGFHRKLIEDQELRKITLIRYARPSDMSDADTRWFDKEVMGKVTLTIQPAGRRGLHLKKKDVVKALDDSKVLSSLLVFDGETYEQIKATVFDAKGREHSILLGENPRTPRAGYDITDNVQFDKRGHPTFASLRSAALQYMDVLVG